MSTNVLIELEQVILGAHFPRSQVECRNHIYEHHLQQETIRDNFFTVRVPVHMERVMFPVWILKG